MHHQWMQQNNFKIKIYHDITAAVLVIRGNKEEKKQQQQNSNWTKFKDTHNLQ